MREEPGLEKTWDPQGGRDEDDAEGRGGADEEVLKWMLVVVLKEQWSHGRIRAQECSYILIHPWQPPAQPAA